MKSDEFYVREVEQAEVGLSLKQSVYEHLNSVIAHDREAERLWFVAVDDDCKPKYHRRCCGSSSLEDLRRQMAYLPQNDRRLVSVHAFERDKPGAETEGMVVTLRLQALEAETGIEFLAHYVVTGRGESAWWRSATGVD